MRRLESPATVTAVSSISIVVGSGTAAGCAEPVPAPGPAVAPKFGHWRASVLLGNYFAAQTAIPSTTATSVMAISRERRLNRRDHLSHGTAARMEDIRMRNQCGTLFTIGVSTVDAMKRNLGVVFNMLSTSSSRG